MNHKKRILLFSLIVLTTNVIKSAAAGSLPPSPTGSQRSRSSSQLSSSSSNTTETLTEQISTAIASIATSIAKTGHRFIRHYDDSLTKLGLNSNKGSVDHTKTLEILAAYNNGQLPQNKRPSFDRRMQAIYTVVNSMTTMNPEHIALEECIKQHSIAISLLGNYTSHLTDAQKTNITMAQLLFEKKIKTATEFVKHTD